MIKKVDGYLLTNLIKHKYLVKVRTFLAAKAVEILDYVKSIQTLSAAKAVEMLDYVEPIPRHIHFTHWYKRSND